MKAIYLDFLNKKKDAKRLAYDDLAPRTNISKSKLHRIFTGQGEPTLQDLEDIVEKGLGASMVELYALVGEQQMADSVDMDFKGARALLEECNAEKKQIRAEYELRIAQALEAHRNAQLSFDSALRQLEERYTANVDYVRQQLRSLESQNVELSARAARAAEIAQASQKRAEAAEERADKADTARAEADKARISVERNRQQVFWGMLTVVVALALTLAFIVVANVPHLGGGNL